MGLGHSVSAGPACKGPPLYPRPMEAPHQGPGHPKSISPEARFIQKVPDLQQGIRALGPDGLQGHTPAESPPSRQVAMLTLQSDPPCPGVSCFQERVNSTSVGSQVLAPLAQILSTRPWARTPHRSEREPTAASPPLCSHLTLLHSPQPPGSRHRQEGIQGSP